MQKWWMAGLLVTMAFAGCLAANDGPATLPGDDSNVRFDDQDVRVTVPVDVFLLGFDDSMADRLEATLPSLALDPLPLDFWLAGPARQEYFVEALGALIEDQEVPPAALPQTYGRVDPGYAYDAVYNYQSLDAALLDDLKELRIDHEGVRYDAEAAMPLLLDAVGPVDPNRPALLLMHMGDETDGHAWYMEGTQGWFDPIRSFDGRETPLLVLDVSAAPDPLGGARDGSARRDYDLPIGEDVNLPNRLALAVEDATKLRLVQAPIYPMPTTDCHAITLVMAVRQDSVVEALPGYADAADWLNADEMTSAFKNLTGSEETYSDLNFISLPIDDPALDALTRNFLGGISTGVHSPMELEVIRLDMVRQYFEDNWEQYHVDHGDHCEEYISLAIAGGPADDAPFGGIAMYSVEETRRFSFSIIPDTTRLERQHGELEEVFYDWDEQYGDYAIFTRLFVHETGHLLGMAHPHNAILEDEQDHNSFAWSVTWDTMSYEVRERVADFGGIPAANFARNQAMTLFSHAITDGATADDLAHVVGHLEAYEWAEASADLRAMHDAHDSH